MRTSHSWQSYLRTVVTPRSPWARLCTSPRAGGRHGVCTITIPFAPSSRGHGKKVPNRHRQRTVYPFSSLLSSSRDIHGAADEVTQVRAVPERSIAQNKYEMGAHSALFSIGQWQDHHVFIVVRPRDGGVGLHDTIVGYVSPTRLQPGPKLFDADPLRADPRRMTFACPSQQEERP